MEKQERLKTILGIGLLYVIVTSAFSLINRICSIMLFQGTADYKIHCFLQGNALWIIVAAAIIISLILYLKKLNQGIYFNLLGDSLIRSAAGTLVILDGIISLSSTIPVYVSSIQSAMQSLRTVLNGQMMLHQVIVSDVISLIILLCQIFAGIYLIKLYKDKAA